MSWLKKNWWIAGLLVALVVALLSPLASQHPDGLERVAEDQGFSQKAEESPLRVLPDYKSPGIADQRLATIVSGLLGVTIIFVLVYTLGRWTRRRQRAIGPTAATAPQAEHEQRLASPPPEPESEKR